MQGLEKDAACAGGRVCVGEIEIKVNLQIRHVTRVDHVYECGARFFPTSDEDRNEMAALVSRLNSVPS